MRRCLVVLVVSWVLLFVSVSQARAQDAGQHREPLWPGGAPGATASDDGDVPELIVTVAGSKKPTAAVVILPGGGYHGHAMDHEGYQFAEWFHSLGVTSAICTYRLRGKGNGGKGYGHPAPMVDAQRALQTLRARAKEWNIDPDRIGGDRVFGRRASLFHRFDAFQRWRSGGSGSGGTCLITAGLCHSLLPSDRLRSPLHPSRKSAKPARRESRSRPRRGTFQ